MRLTAAVFALAAVPALAQEPWIDPELRAPVEAMPAMAIDAETLPALRVETAAMELPTLATPPREEVIEGPGGDLRLLVFDPEPGAAGRPGVLHVHGGGYILGTPEFSSPMNDALSRRCGCVVVSVDYRLAPEAPFPAPLDDAYAGLAWLHDNAGDLGVDPNRLAVLGESAGGGLAAMLAIRARDRGEIPLAAQILIYPMLDDRTASTREVPAGIGELVWTRESNRFGWASLLGQAPGGETAPAGSVPAREEVAGLPPTWICVGALDLFVQEDIDYARRLIEAGVPAELLVVPGAYHGFDVFAPESRAAKDFTAAWQDALARALSD